MVNQPRWYVGHVNTLQQVPIYWIKNHRRPMVFMLPADGLALAFRHINALDVGTPGMSVELSGLLRGIQAYAATCPPPSIEVYPEGLPGLRIVENVPMRSDLRHLIATVPACYSCHEAEDVAVQVDHAGGWFFGCSQCGRAFRLGAPDVCGACEGSGKIEWAQMIAGSEHDFSTPCDWCQGAGR